MIGIKPTSTLPLVAASTAGQSRAGFMAPSAAEPHIGAGVDLG